MLKNGDALQMRQIALFGISPLAVEYEESCLRSKIDILFAVSVADVPRHLATNAFIALGDISPRHLQTTCIVCAFGPARRRRLVATAIKVGFTITDALIDSTSVIANSASVGAGSYINAGVVVGALSIIGDNVLFNRNSSVGHHTVLSDYVSVGPGVTVAK